MKKVIPGLDKLLRIGTVVVLAVTLMYMLMAVVDTSSDGEAPIGSFQTEDFNEGWMLHEGESERPIRLPAALDRGEGEEIIISNTLPEDLSDGMNLMLRGAMEDILIYVDGRLRAEYASDAIDGMGFYIPSAYVVAGLDQADAGKEICIQIRVKTRGVVNGVRIGHGNNVWFEVIKNGLSVNAIALVVFVTGLIILIGTFVMQKFYRVSAARQLALLMLNTAMWVFSESTLRQLFFSRPSLSQYFAYFTVELIAVLAMTYFDEVQHRAYHEKYVLLESVAFLQILLNAILHTIGFMPLYKTMMISHIWTAIGAVVASSCIIRDFIRGRVKEYKITVIGMICFVIMSTTELVGFYVNRFHVFGSSLCLALLMLMIATIIQTVYDEVMASRERANARTDMIIKTIETIAGAIDARDEDTGGHSGRVGFYAGCLAEEMAECYGLDAVDLMRIRYIGLVHDIGKIGVADNVLNKSGRLTEEEYSLMKKHPEIGYEMMSSMGNVIPGLLDGIRYHHERYDGKGYPDGLKGKEIPLVARIMALADSYDAMTSNRVYRRRLSEEEVQKEIRSCAGTQFDPELAEIFLKMMEEGKLDSRTVRGMAADESGKVNPSALLESKVQKDLLQKVPVSDPSHVRMLCYMMKLLEKKGIRYEIVFLGIDEKVPDGNVEKALGLLTAAYKDMLYGHDINIRYTERNYILALYDRDEEGAAEFLKAVKEKYPAAVSEYLTEED